MEKKVYFVPALQQTGCYRQCFSFGATTGQCRSENTYAFPRWPPNGFHGSGSDRTTTEMALAHMMIIHQIRPAENTP